ncbi:MAG: PolC-type DNA polymerase III [Bacillus sp. (in: firmicutes)]
MTPLSELRFTVFDTETTGFHVAKEDLLIEIGAVYVQGFEVLEQRQFQTYINPNKHISQEITQLTSIDDTIVESAPQEVEVISDFSDFVGRYVAFDMLALISELKRQKLILRDCRSIDTLDLIGSLAPSNDMRDLERYARNFNTRIYTRHSAIGDALTTAYLFVELLRKLDERGRKTWGDISLISNPSL